MKKLRYSLYLVVMALILNQTIVAKEETRDLELGIRVPQPKEILETEAKVNFSTYPLTSLLLDSPPYKISILKDGMYCALTDKDKNFIIYDLESKKIIFSEKFFYPIYGLTTHPQKNNIVCFGDKMGRITIFDVDKLQKIHTIMELKYPVADAKFSPDGTVLSVAHFGGTISFYDTENWEKLEEAKIHENSIYTVAFSPDSSMLASGSRDRTVRVTEVGERKPFVILKKPLHLVLCAEFAPQGNFLAAGSADGNVYIWLRTDKEFNDYFKWTHGDWVTSLDFFKDYLFTGCRDGKVRIFDYKNKLLIGMFKSQGNFVRDIKVDSVRNHLLVATKEELLIYDLGEILRLTSFY